MPRLTRRIRQHRRAPSRPRRPARDQLDSVNVQRVVAQSALSGSTPRRAAAERGFDLELLHFVFQLRLAADAVSHRPLARLCIEQREVVVQRDARRWIRWHMAPAPVSASMRRTPAATPDSSVIRKAPMSPVARTCVPPHSSVLNARHRDDAHAVAVLLAEERHRAAASPPAVGAPSVCDRRVAKDLLVDDRSMRPSSSGVTACEVHEVEAQAIGRHQRARLLDVRAEHLAQRRVEEVGRGVVAARRVAERRVHFGASRGRPARSGRSPLDPMRARQARPEAATPRRPRARASRRTISRPVRDLAARLDVERRALERHQAVGARRQLGTSLPRVVEHREHRHAVDRVSS